MACLDHCSALLIYINWSVAPQSIQLGYAEHLGVLYGI